ncbi:MAG: DsbA family protein [Proteobacteria bacterium]|nr:DsbA family protein [Pseudomonadota bacterium]
MPKFLRTLMFGAGVAFAALTGPVLAQSTPPRAEIEAIIKDYLLKNPEVIQEALIELDRRQRDAETAARARVLKDDSGVIYQSKYNAVVGNPQGDVTVVEFFDYNCGYCKRGLADLQRLVKEDGKLKVILKDFPILSPQSRDAAAVAVVVKGLVKPDVFWDFHGKLMAKTGAIGKPQAIEVATSLGVDAAKIEKELARPDIAEAFAETRRLADSLGITGTPSYILGDDLVVGAVGYQQLKDRVDNVRKCGKANCG